MTHWHIVEPVIIPVEYESSEKESIKSAAKNSANHQETVHKFLVDTPEFQNKVRDLVEVQGHSLKEVERLLGVYRTTVRHTCRTLGIGPYAPLRRAEKWSASSQIPYGWQYSNGRLKPHSIEMKWLKLAFKMKANGNSLHSIARFLNEQKVPTKNPNGKWHAKTISKILAANKHLKG